jgi:hypothetical protein
MVAMVTVKCESCKGEFKARAADRKRGWGKFCSKSCKATKQEKRTGQYANYIHGKGKVVIESRDNYRGSGVDRETYEHYQNEHGGTPQFDRRGEYTGFTMTREELAYGGYNNSGPLDEMGDGKW